MLPLLLLLVISLLSIQLWGATGLTESVGAQKWLSCWWKNNPGARRILWILARNINQIPPPAGQILWFSDLFPMSVMEASKALTYRGLGTSHGLPNATGTEHGGLWEPLCCHLRGWKLNKRILCRSNRFKLHVFRESSLTPKQNHFLLICVPVPAGTNHNHNTIFLITCLSQASPLHCKFNKGKK